MTEGFGDEVGWSKGFGIVVGAMVIGEVLYGEGELEDVGIIGVVFGASSTTRLRGTAGSGLGVEGGKDKLVKLGIGKAYSTDTSD